MRNMNLTPRPRDLTMLLNSDRSAPVDTGIPKNRNTKKTESGEEWVKTSVSLRASTRRRLKLFAIEHDTRIQQVIEDALDAYLS